MNSLGTLKTLDNFYFFGSTGLFLQFLGVTGAVGS
jgi:hypothetical protein